VEHGRSRITSAVAVVSLAACTSTVLGAPGSAAGRSAAPSLVSTSSSCTTARVLRTWSVRRLAEQTVVVPVDERHAGRVAPEVAAGAGGVILFGASAPTDLASSLTGLARRAPGGVPPLIMTDEEGGSVQRMANLVGRIPAARTLARTRTPAQIRRVALHAGRRMKALGVTMDLAPVLDLDGRAGPSATNPDGTRSFSPKERIAQRDGLAFAAGLQAAGVVPVVKHFPGLGGATGNTDVMAAATRPWRNLKTNGLLPFAAAVHGGIPAVMVANATVPGLTRLPASISGKVIGGLLRGRLGFHGLVLTDSLSAVSVRAAGYQVPRAAVRALASGADMVLYDATAGAVAGLTRRTVSAILFAVRSGTLTRSRLRNAVLHVLRVKNVTLCG
jgi:beta-N-acetylhexosaminidase